MEQKHPSENSGRMPGAAQRHKYGRKVAPVSRDVRTGNQDVNSDVKSVNYDASSDVTHTYDSRDKVAPSSQYGGSRLNLPDLLRGKVPHIRVLNQAHPREEEVTKCQTKCFFFLLGVALMAFGVGLTFYGADADLRDFLILGPSMLIIGFILIVIGSVLICKDVYILNQSGFSKAQSPDEESYYNIQPVDAEEVTQANNRRMDLYTVTSSRPQTVTSQRSDGVLTTSDLLMEQEGPKLERRDTPDPMVPVRYSANSAPTKALHHPNSAQSKTAQTNNGGSTITVKSSEEGDTCDNTTQNSDSAQDGTEAIQTKSSSTHTVQKSAGESGDVDSPGPAQVDKASYCSPAHTARTAQPVQKEVLTTEL